MKKIRFYPPLVLLFLLFTACDLERFTGFQHDANEILNTAIVQGLVRNTFTNDYISDALVQIGSMQTLTNESGYFKVNYLMSADEQQNKPVKIHISANKYYSKTDEKVIFPLKNHFSFFLDRAAPVIDTTVIFKVADDTQDTIQKYICQAIVGDYQGAASIDSVIALLTFKVPDSRPIKETIHLERIRNISGRTSYWQAAFQQIKEFELIPRYWIIATDNEQYCDSLFDYNEEINDQPLF